MSDNKRRSLVFWPRVDHSDSSSDTEWEDAPLQQLSDKGDSTPLGEGSDPESDAQFRLMAERKTVIVPEKLYKVIIIGDPTVGKTSYVQRYVQNSFKKDYKGTVGVDFALKVLQWSDHQTLKLQLWDIAGQERFTQMTRVYYKDAHGCVIMFDLTNKNSFINTLKWKNDVDEKCQLSNGNPIPCMLLANKCDLPHRQVEQMEIETFYKEHNFIGWTEVSAKEGLMVEDSMKLIIEIDGQSDRQRRQTVNEAILLVETGDCNGQMRFMVDMMMKQERNDGAIANDEDTVTLRGPVAQPEKPFCSC